MTKPKDYSLKDLVAQCDLDAPFQKSCANGRRRLPLVWNKMLTGQKT
jgi:hypothetical protein